MRPSHLQLIIPQSALLLSPLGSATRQGPITPTVTADVTVIDGDIQEKVWHIVAPNPNASGTLAITIGGELGDHRNPPGAVTFATRVRLPSGNANTCYGIAAPGGSPNRAYLGMQSAGTISFVIGNITLIASGLAQTFDQWHTLVGVADGGMATVYCDGRTLVTGAYSGDAQGSSVPSVVILGYPTVFDIAASMLFPCAINPQQVRALHHRQKWSWGME